MKIETVQISSLTLDPENARKHSQKNIDAIAGSLTTFGQRRPLVVWGNIVIAGNGTVEAAKSIGWEKIEITRVPTDWTHDQARAYALADNRTAELAEWDSEILASQLIELDSVGYEIGDWGFQSLTPPSGEEEGQDSTHEIDVDNWSFDNTCPKCGFEFNDKK
jgi:ParB-like chromosome segregation protein Spo0J